MKFSVSFPSILLPEPGGSLALAPDGELAVVWSAGSQMGMGMSRVRRERQETENAVSLVDLAKSKVITTKNLPYKVLKAAVDQQFVYVASAETNYCQVFRKSDFKKVKTLYTQSRVSKLETNGKTLDLNGQIYSLPDLKKGAGSGATTDFENSLWVVRSTGVLQNPGQLSRSQNQQLSNDRSMRLRRMNGAGGMAMSSQVDLDSLSAFAKGWKKTEYRQVPGGTHTGENVVEIGVDLWSKVTNSKVTSVKLLSKVMPQEAGGRGMSQNMVSLAAHDGVVFVLDERNLYSFDTSSVRPDDFPNQLKFVDQPLQIISSSGKTKVKLGVNGGVGPFEYALVDGVEGLEIDETSGVVEIDGAAIHAMCWKAIPDPFLKERRFNSADSIFEALRKGVKDSGSDSLIKKQVKNFPVVFCLRCRAVDSESQRAEGDLRFICDIDLEGMRDSINAKLAQRQKEIAAHQQVERQMSRSSRSQQASASEVRRLREKVEALESRLDLLTRQMSDLIKKIDK